MFNIQDLKIQRDAASGTLHFCANPWCPEPSGADLYDLADTLKNSFVAFACQITLLQQPA